jgi:hypothetical protein
MTLPQKIDNPATNPAQDTVPAADDVLAQIGGIEQQFVAMRELVRKQSIMQLELQRRQVQLDEQTLAAVEAQTALAQARLELSSRKESLDSDRAALAALEADLELRSSTLAREHEQLDAARTQLEQTARKIAAREAQAEASHEEARAKLEEERAEVEARRAAVEQTQSAFEAEHSRLEAMKQAIAQQTRELAGAREELALARDGFDADQAAARSELDAQETRLRELTIQSGTEQQALRELEAALEARESQLSSSVAEHAAKVAADLAALEDSRAQIAAREAAHAADAQRLSDERASLDAAASSLSQRQDEFEQQMRTRREEAVTELRAQEAQVQERALAATKLEATLQADRLALAAQARAFKERHDALIQREEDLATAQEELHGKLTALEERKTRLESVKRQNDAAAAELTLRQDALDALAAKLESRAAELEGGTDGAAIGGASMLMEVVEEYEELWRIERMHGAQMERQHAALAARQTELSHQQEAMNAASKAQALELEAAHQDQAELERVIEGLKERLRETAQRARELESRATEQGDVVRRGSAESSVEMTARQALRRRRLKTYKDLVRRQAVKVRKAGEALTKRFEQVEQVLAMRGDLAAARQRIIQAEKKELRRTAISRTVAPLAGILAIISLTGALSWAIAREIAPAKFAATAVLKAEGRDRNLNGGELAEWQKLHEGLISDPRLHEALAERYKRQGMALLANPGDVAELARGPLTYETGGDGELKLRLEGQGADQTARTLEIFTNGMTNFVNSGSIRRVDGATTAIAQAALAGADPIDNVRTQYTLAMAGGGSLLCSILAFTLWRRLSHAKTTFERDTQLETLIDSVPNATRD